VSHRAAPICISIALSQTSLHCENVDTGLVHHMVVCLHTRCHWYSLNRWIYIALYYKPFISKVLSYGPCVTSGSHSFTYQPLHPSRKASPPFCWYLLHLPMKGWPGWVDLGSRLHTEINVIPVLIGPDVGYFVIKTNALLLRQTTTLHLSSEGWPGW